MSPASRPTPAACVRRQVSGWSDCAGLESRLNGVLIDRYADSENSATRRCASAASMSRVATYYAIEEPPASTRWKLLAELMRMGIAAIKIEAQRSPAMSQKSLSVARRDRCMPAQPG